MDILRYIKPLLIILSPLLLSACLGSLWTGASLIYDRHNVYKTLSDLEIKNNVMRALYAGDDLLDCPRCHLDVAVFKGNILLAGHLDNEALRDEAYRRVKKVAEDYRIFEEISIEPFRTNIAKDSWITAKICSEMIADSDISPKQFKVVTSDRIVYLMGDVQPEQANIVTMIARETTDVRRVVKLFKYYRLSSH